MGYSRFSTRFRRRGFKKVAVGAKPKRKYAPKKRMPMVSFAKRVNAIVSRNIENKCSLEYTSYAPVATYSGTPNKWSWWLFNQFETLSFWQLGQGASQQGRIGNQIKLKRWVIKGLITPQSATLQSDETNYLNNSLQGYVTLYFGRRCDGQHITADLPNFFQSGATSFSPTGRATDILSGVNKDFYKVYFKRRFKVGQSYGANAGTTMLPNNDFALNRTFGFDVCKYVMKNAIVKYNDGTNNYPNNQMLRELAVWATWTPACNQLGQSTIHPTSFYRIEWASYFEYEDA